jgi:hypothetical protein
LAEIDGRLRAIQQRLVDDGDSPSADVRAPGVGARAQQLIAELHELADRQRQLLDELNEELAPALRSPDETS